MARRSRREAELRRQNMLNRGYRKMRSRSIDREGGRKAKANERQDKGNIGGK